MSRSIYDTDFTEYLPACLTHDPTMIALAKSVTNELKNVSKIHAARQFLRLRAVQRTAHKVY